MDRFDLDHVALAALDTSDALRFLTGECGGTVIFGGHGPGFRPMQVFVGTPDGDGMAIELLEPWDTDHNDFLARFLDRKGSGPHHLTFKVPDLRAAVERARGAGYTPVKIDVSDLMWKEAFLMPREAHGTVVQLAESGHEFSARAELLDHVKTHGPNAHPQWWVDPELPAGAPARLRRVVLRTPSLTAALGFFAGLLQGNVCDEGHQFTELAWPQGARLRLEEHAGSEPGIDRLEIEGIATERVLIGTRFVPA